MSNVVHVGPAKATKSEVSLGFELFPDSLHACLREIDDEGNGQLELDELTEIFTKYADMKRAQKAGAIAISSFGDDVQKTLKLFDSSGDGLIEPSELQRAAELYADSKLMVGRLIKLSIVLLLFMGALLGCIAGLTIAVVEGAKEQKTSKSGITTVKGDENTPVAYGKVTNETTLKDAVNMSAEELKKITSLTLPLGKKTLGYTVTGYTKTPGDRVVFFTARGDTVTVDRKKDISIAIMEIKDGTETAKIAYDSSKARRRRRSRRRNLLADGRTLLQDSDNAVEEWVDTPTAYDEYPAYDRNYTTPPPYDENFDAPTAYDENFDAPTAYGEIVDAPTAYGEIVDAPTAYGQIPIIDTDTSSESGWDFFDGVTWNYDLDSDERENCRCKFIKAIKSNINNARRRLLIHDDPVPEPDESDIERLLADNGCDTDSDECEYGCEQLFGEWAPMCSFADSYPEPDSDDFGAEGDVGTPMPKPM